MCSNRPSRCMGHGLTCEQAMLGYPELCRPVRHDIDTRDPGLAYARIRICGYGGRCHVVYRHKRMLGNGITYWRAAARTCTHERDGRHGARSKTTSEQIKILLVNAMIACCSGTRLHRHRSHESVAHCQARVVDQHGSRYAQKGFSLHIFILYEVEEIAGK